ncbi:MAG: serine acetyltransferase [Prevotella sp.]|nr:serine acetyltransferase [Candidatus Prevotella equi]
MNQEYCIRDTINLIKDDFYSYFHKEWSLGRILCYSLKTFFKGFGWVVLLRFSQCRCKFIAVIAKILKTHYAHKYCIDIPACINIGKRFSIGHGYGIVIHGNTVIGDNVTVSQFVNIGSTNGEFAVIGNNVYIGPMTCIVGGVRIGNNVTIGAGSVVVKDIPDNATAAGNPARVLNYDNPGMKIGVKKMN